MSHGIEDTDKFADAAGKGRAWHGLGDALTPGQKAVAAFAETGIDWGTELLPVYAEKVTADGVSRIELPGNRVHVRADNGNVLGMVTDGYKPFENMDLARLADSLVDEGHQVTVETCGTLFSGRRVYVLVKLPNTIEASRSDVLEQYICISNGHGGFCMLSAYPTSIRVVCANTLRWSERDVMRGCRFRHSGDFETKVKQARLVLGLAAKETASFEEQVASLVRTNLSVQKARAYMLRTYEQCFGKIDEEGDADTVAKLVAKRKKVTDKWMANLEDSRQQLAGIQGTAWAAYNAVSQWHDHERGRFRTVHESGARVHSNLFGVSQKHKLRAFSNALALK